MLVGREAERARIAELLGSARAGRGGALLLRGEPGIGKSALLRFASEQASGLRVLHALGVEAEAELPFSGLIELLRPLLGLVDGLPEAQAQALRSTFVLGPRLEGKLLIALATVSLLSAAAEERPVLCVVDDAHWLDVASAEAFAFAARRVEDDPVAMLFSARVGEPRRFEVPGVEEIEVQGLAPAEAQELLSRGGYELGPGVAEQLQAAVRGNPLALLELPAALADGQRSGVEPLAEPLPVTEAVQAAFARRIERLPADTRRALVLAAAELSGRQAAVARALGLLGADAAALEAAEDDGLVDIAGGRLTFRHPLVRAAAYFAAPASERRRVHRALADAAAELRETDARAWHLAASAAGSDEEAAAALEAVGERAKVQGTLVASVSAFERAAALSPNPEERARRLCRAARAYGRIRGMRAYDAGGVVVAEALPRASESGLRVELEYWEAFFLIHRDPRRAYDLLLASAAALADRDPAFASLLAAEALFVAVWYLDIDRIRAASTASRAHARRAPALPDPYVVLVRALAQMEAGRLAAAGPFHAAADAVIGQLRDVVAGRGDYTENLLPIYRWAAMYRAVILIADPQQQLALRAELEGVRAAWAAVGDGAALTIVASNIGQMDYRAGRWNDARARLAEAEDMCRELGENRALWHVVAAIAELAAARGAEGECRSYHDALKAINDGGVPFRSGMYPGFLGGAALGLLALGRRDFERAVEEYERVLLPSLGPFVLAEGPADAIEAYVAVGRRADAQHWLVPFAAQARASGWAWAQARAAHLALLLADDDRLDEAFVAAIGCHERAEQPFPRARTELAYGERLRRVGLRRRAREHLWAEHAAAELRATGERVSRRADADTSRLTPQELHVALVVARGATNKEAAAQLYLSPKTIEKHLGSTYSKLGLRSRTELAGVLLANAPPVHAPATT
jgi:DNA-binding CsgD family transcriptional regulator